MIFVYSNNYSLLYFDRFLVENILPINLKVHFQDGVSGIWNIITDELFHSDVLFEIDFMHSTKESENKEVECIFYNGKFSKDERGELRIKGCSLRAHWTIRAEKAKYIYDFYK